MGIEAIELYKPYDAKKASFPGFVSRKLDGVPIRVRRLGPEHCFGYSRQNEVITSVPHVVAVCKHLLDIGGSLTGELYIEGMPFKDISGLVRQKKATAESMKLVMHLHDFDCEGQPAKPYSSRMIVAQQRLTAALQQAGTGADDISVRIIPGIVVHDAAAVSQAFELVMQANPKAEGVVFHDLAKPYAPGFRRWTGMKIKRQSTLDVWVTGFEEAVDKFGVPKGMVGTVNVSWYGINPDGSMKTITGNIGPGKLTALERKLLWVQYKEGKFASRLAEAFYMPDDTYEGLREGRFIRWRDDKRDADVRD
ncbi:ATP-dependent DNA ligase protein [Rhizobium phage RHph_N37]|uniref:ATP-dependent DNA ligase protein n=1 Tax=Rhizobium phage RHph_N37 TaxID=2509749 RepID=A0A7S5UWB9_9CAUD|nr:ATP-dependent DNA ligase protein [Rhizobium phage RHph_N37]